MGLENPSYAKDIKQNKCYELRSPHKRDRKSVYLSKDYGGDTTHNLKVGETSVSSQPHCFSMRNSVLLSLHQQETLMPNQIGFIWIRSRVPQPAICFSQRLCPSKKAIIKAVECQPYQYQKARLHLIDTRRMPTGDLNDMIPGQICNVPGGLAIWTQEQIDAELDRRKARDAARENEGSTDVDDP